MPASTKALKGGHALLATRGGSGLVHGNGQEDGEDHNRNDLIIGPVIGKIRREEPYQGIDHTGHLAGFDPLGQGLVKPLAHLEKQSEDQSNHGCREGIDQQEHDGLQADVLEPAGPAYPPDAGDDAEEQEGDHYGRYDLGPDGAEGSHVSGVAREANPHDDSQYRGYDDPPAEVDLGLLAQQGQPCKKDDDYYQSRPVPTRFRHRISSFSKPSQRPVGPGVGFNLAGEKRKFIRFGPNAYICCL